MSVYFMQAVVGGPVKIGTAVDVEKRRRELGIHYGCDMAILATMPGGREEEQAVHEKFAHLRFGRTEQFRPASELMAFIDRPLFVNQGDVDLVEPLTPVRTVGQNVRKLRLADPEWEALSRVAEREGLLYGGVPSPAEAVRFLLKFYGEREAQR